MRLVEILQANVLSVYLRFRVTSHPYLTSQLSISLFTDWSEDLARLKGVLVCEYTNITCLVKQYLFYHKVQHCCYVHKKYNNFLPWPQR